MNKTFLSLLSIRKTEVSIFTIWLVCISGMIGIWLGQGDWFLPKTPFNLLLGASLLYWNFPAKNGRRSLAVWTLIYLLGMAVEILGVNTGLLFGEYYYGENLGPKLLGVPLLIGINWVVLIFLTATICKRFIKNKWLSCICAALLMVALDFFIEPVAPIFDFWHWNSGEAPLRNFTDWFFVSLVLQLLAQKDLYDTKHPLPLHYFASQAVFFVFFYAVYQL